MCATGSASVNFRKSSILKNTGGASGTLFNALSAINIELGNTEIMSDVSGKLLAGKTAIVTGSGRGLGRAFAETLANLGCNVGIHGMRENGPAEYGEGTTLTDTAREIGETFGVKTVRALGDLTDNEQAGRIVQEVTDALGPIDILVHNAGGDIAAKGGKPNPNDAVMIKEEDVRSVMDRNLLSTVFINQHISRSMMERKTGRIINISSIAAFRGSANSAIYSTSKAAVVEYTRCLALQLRPYDITVNSLAPGDTRTGRFLGTREVDQDRLAESGTLERIALVDEVARVVEFFAGPMGQFVTGQALRVDGGEQCWPS
ncbi:MAG: 3-oxoacyl-[acyl-carrier protein] reductase [Planctomycetaceae bacterium]